VSIRAPAIAFGKCGPKWQRGLHGENGRRTGDSDYLFTLSPTLNGFNQCERHFVANCSLPRLQLVRQSPRLRERVRRFYFYPRNGGESGFCGSHESVVTCEYSCQACIMTTLAQRKTANSLNDNIFQCKQLQTLEKTEHQLQSRLIPHGSRMASSEWLSNREGMRESLKLDMY
jgi:hypothetical protein